MGAALMQRAVVGLLAAILCALIWLGYEIRQVRFYALNERDVREAMRSAMTPDTSMRPEDWVLRPHAHPDAPPVSKP